MPQPSIWKIAKYIDFGMKINLSQKQNHKGTKIPQCINTPMSYKMEHNYLIQNLEKQHFSKK